MVPGICIHGLRLENLDCCHYQLARPICHKGRISE